MFLWSQLCLYLYWISVCKLDRQSWQTCQLAWFIPSQPFADERVAFRFPGLLQTAGKGGVRWPLTCWVDFSVKNLAKLYRSQLHPAEILCQQKPDHIWRRSISIPIAFHSALVMAKMNEQIFSTETSSVVLSDIGFYCIYYQTNLQTCCRILKRPLGGLEAHQIQSYTQVRQCAQSLLACGHCSRRPADFGEIHYCSLVVK